MRYLILDVATAPLADAGDYLDDPSPDGRLTDPQKIEADIAKKRAAAIDRCGLDLDLCRITALGLWMPDKGGPFVHICKTEEDETFALLEVAAAVLDEHGARRMVITYNGHAFDLHVLMRRARYLGVKTFPTLSTDRYKSTNRDLLLDLSDRDKTKARTLGFYAKRLGMGLTKPLSGEQESRVHETGDWAGLEASIIHDLTATKRLAEWMGVL